MTVSQLLSWLLLLISAVYQSSASVSTSLSFPQDVFAKPAFGVRMGQAASLAPIRKSVALSLLGKQESTADTRTPATDPVSLAVASARTPDSSADLQHQNLLWTLQRSSATSAYLCSIPDFSARTKDSEALQNNNTSRSDLIQIAQRLLEPLKKGCLYHTIDWFTYSFCHGRDIRQFRLLTPQSAAADAHKKAGGGNKGDKAAVEAAKKIADRKEPMADPIFPAFTLGRWKVENDDIVGETQSRARASPSALPADDKSTTLASHNLKSLPPSESIGTDLVEEVQFGDWDEEELVAAEASVLASLDSISSASEPPAQDRSHSGGSKRHRYITQTWSDGTLCDVNNQPRTTEVQFHCSHRKHPDDRITLIKETTICNYVMVIETSRLCSEPAFVGETEDTTHQLRCHEIVDDSFQGLTLGDTTSERKPDSVSASRHAQPSTSTTSKRRPSDASSSHTYGDLSQFNSVYDDYYDEALGNHGPQFEQLKKEHLENLYGPDGVDDRQRDESGEVVKESLFYVGIDENGKLIVQSAEDSDEAMKEAAARLRGDREKQTAAEQTGDEVEIQLDLDDLLNVLTGGDDGGSLEKKLSRKIAEQLEKIQKHDDQSRKAPHDRATTNTDPTADDGDDVLSKGLTAIYKQLMRAVDATGSLDANKKSSGDGSADRTNRKPSEARPKAADGGGTDADQPKQKTMEKKVADSLAERAQRFYDTRDAATADNKRKKKHAHVDL